MLLYLYITFRREDRKPHANDKVCSCHFKGGDTTLEIPSIFNWNKDKSFNQFQSPEKKKRRKQQ